MVGRDMNVKRLAAVFGILALGAAASAPASASDIDDCNGAGGANSSTISAACTRIIQGPPSGALSTAYNNRGNAFFMKGEHGPAIADYNRAIELDPADALAYFNRGRSFGTAGRASEALADFNKAIELDPKLGAAYNSRGLAFAVKGDHDRALADYNKAIGLAPKDPLALLFNRARSLLAKGQSTQAIADFTKMTEFTPNDAKGFILRGSAYAITREQARAISDFGEAIRLQPGSRVYNLRGRAWADVGDVAKARADFEAALRLPDEKSAAGGAHKSARAGLEKLGSILPADKSPKSDAEFAAMLAAEDARLKQVRSTPTAELQMSRPDADAVPVNDCDKLAASPWDYRRLVPGVSYHAIKSQQAILACRAAVGAFPENNRFAANLARALHKGGFYDEARPFAEMAAGGGTPSAMMLLGHLYENGYALQQDFTEARGWYERAAAKGDAVAMHLLGSIYELGQGVSSDPETALNWYKRAAEKGNVDAIIKVENNVGPGFGDEAVRGWYMVAARRGDIIAINKIAGLAATPDPNPLLWIVEFAFIVAFLAGCLSHSWKAALKSSLAAFFSFT